VDEIDLLQAKKPCQSDTGRKMYRETGSHICLTGGGRVDKSAYARTDEQNVQEEQATGISKRSE
jgi:hypothetical protein